MDYIIDILIQWGPWGMFIAAFLAGSFFPFPSEVVIGGVYSLEKQQGVADGSLMWTLLWTATLGNVLGGVFNYSVGMLCSEEYIIRKFKIKPKKWEKSKRWTQQYGFWGGFLAWVPFLGSAITIAQGFMRVNFWLSTLTSTIGKALRYILILMALGAAF